MKNFLLVFLLTVTAFCVYKYIVIQSEKISLSAALAQAKEEGAKSGKEKENILQQLEIEKELRGKPDKEKLLLKENLKAAKSRITKLFLRAGDDQLALTDLGSRCTLLKAENQYLGEQNKSFQQLSKDYEALKARFSSVAELKKAIKELGARQPKIDVKVESQAVNKNAAGK